MCISGVSNCVTLEHTKQADWIKEQLSFLKISIRFYCTFQYYFCGFTSYTSQCTQCKCMMVQWESYCMTCAYARVITYKPSHQDFNHLLSWLIFHSNNLNMKEAWSQSKFSRLAEFTRLNPNKTTQICRLIGVFVVPQQKVSGFLPSRLIWAATQVNHVFWVSGKVTYKQSCSTTETS